MVTIVSTAVQLSVEMFATRAGLRNLTQRSQRTQRKATERSTAKEGLGIDHESGTIDSSVLIAVDMLATHGHLWLRLRSGAFLALNVFRSLSARAFRHPQKVQWMMRWAPRAVPV